jgi:hypothetical protein
VKIDFAIAVAKGRSSEAIASDESPMIAARQSSLDERLSEVGTLLGKALTRLLSRKSSAFSASSGESSLHISPNQSVRGSPDEYGDKA